MRKILKGLLKFLLVAALLFFVLLVTPRILSFLRPGKPPVGYYFNAPTYLAIALKLEKLIDKEPAIPIGVEEIKNIEYKNIHGKSLEIDIYRPKKLQGKVPLLVFIHGGGWRGGQRSDYKVYLLPFAEKGYITATVSYRLIKDGIYPASAEDISDAFRWLYQNGDNYGYDADKIAVIGGSAGSHLAMLAAYGWENENYKNDSTGITSGKHRIKALVEIYGPTDLTTKYARKHKLVTDYLGTSYDKNPALFKQASPISYLDKNDPPTMILHGTSDQLVPISQADLLKAKLDSLGVPNIYYRLPGWPHTMDLSLRVNQYCQQKMDEFFNQYLK